MPFDVNRFAEYLRLHATGHSLHCCAKYVRKALEAGGANTTGHPVSAKAYGRIMRQNAFYELPVDMPETYLFIKGDVVVFQNYRAGNQHGHIAGYDGSNWISDFIQHQFWSGIGYAKARPSFAVYRP